jgi:hypothetical protein
MKDLDLRYKMKNLEKRAEILKIISSDFILDGETLIPV